MAHITMTQSAADQIKHLIAAEPDALGLRVGITPSGCSGYAYTLDLARQLNDDDHVFQHDDARVIIDETALNMLDGTEVDYVSEGLNRLFKFHNPNVKDECGCGESFSV